MGYSVADTCFGPDKEAGGGVSWKFSIGRVSPVLHVESPSMTATEARDLVEAAQETGLSLAQWVDACPSGVETWLEALPTDGARQDCRDAAEAYYDAC